ncbi:polyketide synthase [Pochonia chlamydosporia 170]|uniref:Polyketide synthase n=1 Tax=Pochonia chlamydosporia 170 TaxID=1380566 RepID=A0A179F8U0_METCM|nr:polyketide synthase [Pochonia chlamydosporia 170]OAQ61797.1 polyketide synthase [Pochonia chlamydosporia 170]
MERCRKLLGSNGFAAFVSLPPEQDDTLNQAGFCVKKVFEPFYIADVQLQPHLSRTTISTSQTIQIIYRSLTPYVKETCDQFVATFGVQGYDIAISAIDDHNSSIHENILLLTDLELPLLVDMGKEEFLGLQRITNSAKNIIWPTNGDLTIGKRPEYNLSTGFSRSLRTEQAALNIITVDFDDESKHNLVGIVSQKLLDQVHGHASEHEYCVIGNKTFISRVQFDEHLNKVYCVDEHNLEEKAVEVAGPVIGKIQNGNIVFEADHRPDPLEADEVEVEVWASGLNKEGVLAANGTDLSVEFSHEISGVVSQVGKKVTDLAKGDLVYGFSFNKLATFQRVPQYILQKLSDESEICERASLPMAFGAALYGLDTLARLSRNETLLILPGSGLAGNAAIHIAKTKGAMPYICVLEEREVDAVAQLYNLPTKQVICLSELENIRGSDSSFFQFDVIFSSGWTDPAIVREVWRYIAPFGRFVHCGRKRLHFRAAIDSNPVKRGANYLAFDMIDIYTHRRRYFETLIKGVEALYQLNEIAPLGPLVTRDIGQINGAIADFSDHYTSGKTVLVHKKLSKQQDSAPLQILPAAPSLKLRPDVTYLLVGCLGGLGRSLTLWMISKGARTFMFLSRSGADSKQAAALMQNLLDAGASVTVVRGDVSVKADVEQAVASVDPDRPIRGVIHAAMVLQDGLFHNMTYESWVASTDPKVKGARNLHDALTDQPLDFFVMTSSISGTMGTPAQTNYAAGNTYMDALATHRINNGMHAMSIIIPMVLGIGVVSENLELEASLKWKGMYGIDDESLMAAFEVAIIEQADSQNVHGNLIAGLDPVRLEAAITEAGEDIDCFWRSNPRFKSVVRAMNEKKGDMAQLGNTILKQLTSGELGGSEARDTVAASMARKLSRMLMIDREDVRVNEGSITSYGIDSMIGAELRTWIFKEFAVDIPFQQLLGAAFTIFKFADFVCTKHRI